MTHSDPSRALVDRVLERDLVESPQLQVRAILDRADHVAFIEGLDPYVLFSLIKTAGWDSGRALVPYASSAQVQTFVDLDCWRGDRFAPDSLMKWISVLTSDATDARFNAACRETDSEILAMFFKVYLKVGMIEEGQIPPELDHHEEVARSPDGVYAIVYPEDADTAALIRVFLRRLYDVDFTLAHILLEAVRWELMSPIEEAALRWRTSRLEEFGFVPRHQAIAVYSSVDPEAARVRFEAGELRRPKAVLSDDDASMMDRMGASFDDFSLLKEALGQIDDEIRQVVITEIVSLQNQTFVADGIEPGDVQSAHEIGFRTLGYLNLGLEFLSRCNADDACVVLKEVPIREVFGVGFGVVTGLRNQVLSLRHRPALTVIESNSWSLLRHADAGLFDAVSRNRPVFTEDGHLFRAFSQQRDVDLAAFRIGRVACQQLWLFGVAGLAMDQLAQLVYGDLLANDPATITFDAFLGVAIVEFALGVPIELRGLTNDEVDAARLVFSQSDFGDRQEQLCSLLQALPGETGFSLPESASPFMKVWVREVVDRLRESLAAGALEEMGGLHEALLVAIP
jgi:hypothetical protein